MRAMSGVAALKPQLREKLATLEEAHRPLDAHWSHPSKYRLDSRDSDGKYKHHITNLEEIYNAHRQQQPAPHHFHVESPGTVLYGVKGLLSTVPGVEEKMKRREDSWVSNHQKYAVLSDPAMIDYDRLPSRPAQSTMRRAASSDQFDMPRTLSLSPDRSKRMGASNNNYSTEGGFGGTATFQATLQAASAAGEAPPSVHKSSRCYNENYTEQDLIMLDMYRLDARQDEAYRAFVQLLSEFDEHDAQKIVRDAMQEARKNDLMVFYGGTELEPADADQE